MLNILLVAVGNHMPDWVDQGCREYMKRVRGNTCIELREIPAGKRGKNTDISRIVLQEESRISDAVAGRDRVIALDRNGRSLSTQDLAKTLSN